jgi:sugar lactone lactonase YvrE
MRRIKLAIALMASAVAASGAYAQPSYPCTTTGTELPNPYRLVTGWAQTPRPWGPNNALTIDVNNNLWVVDRCPDDQCQPVFELSPQGRTLKNFGAGLFVEPHSVTVDIDGNIWVADAQARPGKGFQVTKLSPDGRVLLKLGKPGEGAGLKGLDTFDAPTGVVAASNGDIFVAEGHGEATENNSRIMKFTKEGRFIKTFATRGPGDGQLRSPHAIAIDSQDRIFVGDRSNSRVVIFDKDGNFIAAWKQFGRPSGIYVDKNDMLYVADSQSSDAPGAANYNPGCRRGIRIGSTKDGRVQYFIPPPVVTNPIHQPPIAVAVDHGGAIYLGSDDQMTVHKFVKN